MSGEFNHIQSWASDLWTVEHNLDAEVVACDVYIENNGVLEKILPADIVHFTPGTLNIYFSAPFEGRARVVTHEVAFPAAPT